MTPQQIELALETIALVLEDLKKTQEKQQATITAIKEALKEHAMSEVQRLGQEIEQEPVAWWNDTGTHIDLNVSGRGAPLYTAPPQRTWVGLTAEEVLQCWEKAHKPGNKEHINAIRMADEVEAKLKEKNCG